MKLLRWMTCILFLVVLAGFVSMRVFLTLTEDTSQPVISVPEGVLEVSIHADDADLLAGVTAHDEKDGDLTALVVVESISAFIGEDTCMVMYAVADGDRHVAKATRLLRYTDYTPPHIYLNRPLVFAVGERVDFREMVGAVDCIDGDISDSITFVASDYTSANAGVYTLSVQVASSRGDNQYYDFPVFVEATTPLAPEIRLRENLIYLPVGAQPDFASYVEGVYQKGELLPGVETLINTDCDPLVPGLYTVQYFAAAPSGAVGHTVLTVIVEE